jgi:hypothetical protein
MTKASDIDDLLGDGKSTKAPKGKTAKTKAPKAEAAAKTTAKKAAPAAEAKAPKAKRERPPVTFEEGEKEALMKRIPKLLKHPIGTKDLAAKLEIPTRKLRPVLYSMQRAGLVSLELAASRAQGMTVSAAA